MLALAVLATVATAQTPPPPARQIKIDISPAGEAVVKKYLGVRDPFVVQQVEQLRAIGQQMQALTTAPRIDLVRMRAAMRRQEGVQAAIARHNNDRMVAMLTELSQADRVKFVRSVGAAQTATRPPAGK